MLQYMLDTNICIYVIKSRPIELREQFNRLTEQICISTITLAELYYGVEKSSRRAHNLQAVAEFVARLEALQFSVKAAANYGQVRAALQRTAHLPRPPYMFTRPHART